MKPYNLGSRRTGVVHKAMQIRFGLVPWHKEEETGEAFAPPSMSEYSGRHTLGQCTRDEKTLALKQTPSTGAPKATDSPEPRYRMPALRRRRNRYDTSSFHNSHPDQVAACCRERSLFIKYNPWKAASRLLHARI
ncbi:hypothetical protein EYF80_011714 [Liparis tanakae]|uniref:Uncharacterized protein n=1 Tax=Liparis tanakae TaxID=230148 RepID=A0A4Z2IL88_9TELE|nr:hypothetical protein EYF80_011714 [Liparis tanakae]